MTKDKFGVYIPSALPPLDAQEIELLRLLGRLELLTIQQARAAAFPHMTRRGVSLRLEAMLADEVLWRTPTRTALVSGAGARTRPTTAPTKLKTAYAYGLSNSGKILLETLEVEQNQGTLHRLRSRDPRGKKPDARTLAHDLQVSWWCLSVLLEASRNRFCRSVYAQVEFIPERRQRIDALIILRMSLTRPREPEEIGRIPWFDGTPCAQDEVDVRFALEVDRGTEELRVLLEKAIAYRDLTFDGIYTAVLGGPVLPVFLVPSARRAAQIATEFRDAWPGGWGVISTPQQANHPTGGALWGNYRALADGISFPLLTAIPVDQNGQVSFQTLCGLERWQQAAVEVRLPQSPEQEYGRAGGEAKAARRRARTPQPPAEDKATEEATNKATGEATGLVATKLPPGYHPATTRLPSEGPEASS